MSGFVLVVLAGIGAELMLHNRLFDMLNSKHPDLYQDLGEPTLLSWAPGQNFNILRFIYRHLVSSEVDHGVVTVCRTLAILTPVLIVIVVTPLLWALR